MMRKGGRTEIMDVDGVSRGPKLAAEVPRPQRGESDMRGRGSRREKELGKGPTEGGNAATAGRLMLDRAIMATVCMWCVRWMGLSSSRRAEDTGAFVLCLGLMALLVPRSQDAKSGPWGCFCAGRLGRGTTGAHRRTATVLYGDRQWEKRSSPTSFRASEETEEEELS